MFSTLVETRSLSIASTIGRDVVVAKSEPDLRRALGSVVRRRAINKSRPESSPLTVRETEILGAIAAGLGDRENLRRGNFVQTVRARPRTYSSDRRAP